MKSEIRHKRAQNDLAYYLEKFITATKEYHVTILTVFLGAVLLLIAVSVYRGVSSANNARQWNQVYSLSGALYLPPDRVMHGFQSPLMQQMSQSGPRYFRPDDTSGETDAVKLAEKLAALKAFGKAHAGKTVGVVALLESGTSVLKEASTDMLGNNRDEAADRLKEALETLQLAEKHAAGELHTQAQLALARAFELSAAIGNTDENLEKAKEKYALVAKSGTPLGALAKDSLATLERPETKGVFVVLAENLSNFAMRSDAVDQNREALQKFNAPDVQDTIPFLNALPPIENEPVTEFPEFSGPENTSAIPEVPTDEAPAE